MANGKSQISEGEKQKRENREEGLKTSASRSGFSGKHFSENRVGLFVAHWVMDHVPGRFQLVHLSGQFGQEPGDGRAGIGHLDVEDPREFEQPLKCLAMLGQRFG